MYTLLQRTVSVLVIASLVLSPVRVYADVEMPTGGSIAVGNGSGTIGAVSQDVVNGTATQTITQTSDRMIADWTTFSIGNGGTVKFKQPSQSSIALNRVNGGSPSNIYGTLKADGRIFLVNPNGVLFGAGSQIDAAGLVASTLAYAGTDAQFMSGTNTFAFANNVVEGNPGSVINAGTINSLNAPGGFVALLAPSVQNSGVITVASNLGRIALAAGDTVTLSLDPLDLISVTVGDPGAADYGVINSNSGELHAQNGKVLINGQVVDTVLKHSVNNTGIIEANDIVITGNGDIELQSGTQSWVAAWTDSGSTSVKIETTEGAIAKSTFAQKVSGGDEIFDWLMSNGYFTEKSGTVGHPEKITDALKSGLEAEYPEQSAQIISLLQQIAQVGNVNVSGTEVSAIVLSEGPTNGAAKIDILAGGENSQVNIDNSTVESIVYGSGSAAVNITAGSYDSETSPGAQNGDGKVDKTETLAGNGKVTIANDSQIAAEIKNSMHDGASYTSIGIKAQDISISDSFALALNNGYGTSTIDIFAGAYKFETAWSDYMNKDFVGGTLDVARSGILASTADGAGEGVGSTHVRLYAHDITLDGSAVVAQQEESGSAIVDVYAGSIYQADNNLTDTFYSAGNLTIENPVTAFTDDKEYLIIDSLPSVAALVGKDGHAEVDIEGGRTVIDKATIIAEVFGDGDAIAGIYAGDYSEHGEDKDLSDYGKEEQYKKGLGGNDTGTIDMVDSSMLSKVDGQGAATAELYASGDIAQEGTKEKIVSKDPTGGITLDNSSVTAEAVGGGYEDAQVVMQAGNYSMYKDNGQINERLDGGSINIQNDSSVLAKTASLVDNSYVELKARDITIDNSSVKALVDNEESGMANGFANVLIRAGEWVNYFYPQHEDGYAAVMAGSLNIQNGKGVYAEVTGSGNASVELEAFDILLDHGQAQAKVGYNGDFKTGTGIRMIGGTTHWYRNTEVYQSDDSFLNTEGTINIINDSAVLASVGNGIASDKFYVNQLGVKDSSVDALVTAGKSGMASVEFYQDNGVDSYADTSRITIDHGILKADVAGLVGSSLIKFGYDPGILEGSNGVDPSLGVSIINHSEVTASVKNGESSVEVDAHAIGDVNIQDSKLSAFTDGQGIASLDFNLMCDGECSSGLNIVNSDLKAEVTGEGYSSISVYNSEIDFSLSNILEDLNLYNLLYSGMIKDRSFQNGPIVGRINIDNSIVQSIAHSTSDFSLDDVFSNEEDIGAAVIGMMSYGPVTLTNNTKLSAQEANHPAAVGIFSDDKISIDATSKITAITSGSDSLAAVGLISTSYDYETGNSLDIVGTVSAAAGDGIGVVGLLGTGNVNASGTISASGNADAVSMLTGLLLGHNELSSVSLGLPGNFGSAVLIGSTMGDVRLGNISGALVGVAALGESYLKRTVAEGVDSDIVRGNILGTSGVTKANLLLMLARGNIGTAEQPINTNVDVVAGFSFEEGDIYLNEADDIALGLFVPISVSRMDVKSLLPTDTEEDTFNFGLGISLAARNGIVHVESQGDMVVNSVLSPQGGVYLKSFNGSIYAGNGWNPSFECGEDCDPADGFVGFLSGLGVKVSKGLYYGIEDVLEMSLMANPFAGNTQQAQEYFLPFMIGTTDENGKLLNDGPNVIAGGYSYFATPHGTIGVGYPTDKDPNISGQISGVVRPGTTAVTGLSPSVDLDLSQGVPPGLVYYDDNDQYGWAPLDGSTVSGSGPQQVWPVAPVVTPVLDNVNPLRVHIDVLPESKPAIPTGFTPLLSGLTLQIGTLIPPPQPNPEPPVDTGVSQLVNPLLRNFRAYYEILHNFRLVSVEPITPTTFFAYHPLSEADTGAFDGINLDPNAYEYIDGNLNYNGDMGFWGDGNKK